MNVLLDYDSTIAHTFTKQIEMLNKEFGTDYKRSMFTMWNTEEILTKEEVVFLWGPHCFMSEEFQASCAPVENAIESVRTLMNEGHEFIIASDRPDELYDVTRDWLNDHGLGDVKLIFTKHAQAVGKVTRKSVSKLDVIAQYGLSIAIDDAPHHAETFAALDQIEEVYLLTYPHNRGIKGNKITRCRNWKDLMQKFHERHPYNVVESGLIQMQRAAVYV